MGDTRGDDIVFCHPEPCAESISVMIQDLHNSVLESTTFLFITEKKQKVLLWFVHFAFCYRLIFGNSKNSALPQTVPNFFKNLVDRITKFTKRKKQK